MYQFLWQKHWRSENALKRVIQENYHNFITESESLIAIHAINGKSKPPTQICNLDQDIIMFARVADNIKFVYCYRPANEMADKIAKRTLLYCNRILLVMINSLVCFQKNKK